MLDFLIVTDDGFDKENPLHSGGATTRLAAIAAQELEQNGQARVQYFHLPTDMAALKDYIATGQSAALLIRNQIPEMQQAQQALQAKGVKVFFHLADPHVTNDDPAMAARRELHAAMLQSCDGVIATSEANAQVGLNYNANTVTIADVLDVPLLATKTAWLADDDTTHIVSYGYGAHHPGFYNAALDIKAFANQTERKIRYHLCTSDKAPLEKITHASASKTDYFDKLTELAGDEFFSLKMHSPFAIGTFLDVMRQADIALIPSVPAAEKTAFQQKWFPKKGPVRAMQGIASGCLTIVEGTPPESYQLFRDNDALLCCDNVTQGLKQAFALTAPAVEAMLENGRQIIADHYAPAVIAARYLSVLSNA